MSLHRMDGAVECSLCIMVSWTFVHAMTDKQSRLTRSSEFANWQLWKFFEISLRKNIAISFQIINDDRKNSRITNAAQRYTSRTCIWWINWSEKWNCISDEFAAWKWEWNYIVIIHVFNIIDALAHHAGEIQCISLFLSPNSKRATWRSLNFFHFFFATSYQHSWLMANDLMRQFYLQEK